MRAVMVRGLFDELEKIAQGGRINWSNAPLGPPMLSQLGEMKRLRALQEAAKKLPAAAEKVVSGAQTFLKKGSVATPVAEALARSIMSNPGTYLAAASRHKTGMDRHRQMMAALDRPSPAGWVPLGIRPG